MVYILKCSMFGRWVLERNMSNFGSRRIINVGLIRVRELKSQDFTHQGGILNLSKNLSCPSCPKPTLATKKEKHWIHVDYGGSLHVKYSGYIKFK